MPHVLIVEPNNPGDKIGQVGGHPMTPIGFSAPKSISENANKDFIFQVFFPSWHQLYSYTLLFFFDLYNVDESFIIPEYSTPDVYPPTITPKAISEQQKYYSVLLFEAEKVSINSSITSPLSEKKLIISNDFNEEKTFGRIDNVPIWVANDETPPGGSEAIFCLQFAENCALDLNDGCALQLQIDYFSDKGTSERASKDCIIFAGNEIYFFAYSFSNENSIFVCLQNSD